MKENVLKGPIQEFFNPVIPTQNFVRSFGYVWHPTPAHIFNPEPRPDFAAKSQILSLK